MQTLKTIGRELLGLFVDDGAYAAAIIGWLALTAFALPSLVDDQWRAPVFALGLLVILAATIYRKARHGKF